VSEQNAAAHALEKQWTVKDANALKDALKNVPPKPVEERPVTRREVINMVADEIRELRQKGYTLEEIAEILKTKGCSIEPKTLKNAIRARKPASADGRSSASTRKAKRTSKNKPSQSRSIEQ
jgi:hypothetical protein